MKNEKHKGAVKLIKKDAATDKELRGAEFKLVDSEGEVVKESLTTNAHGEIFVDNLFLGDYQLIETKAPAGYERDETPIDIEITEDNQVVEKTMTNNKIINISVEKKWNNDGGDTEPVTVKLLPTDETVELNEDNDWKATFEDQDVYDKDGSEIDYQVEELEVDGYNSVVTGDSSDGFVVTNTETTSVSGEKTWKDDNSHKRPDQITVKLLADGEQVATEKVTVESDWKFEFTDLDKYDEDGREITYTIDEVEVNGYETNIDGFDITNVRVGETEVSGTKTWLDDDSEFRPKEIIVNLLANGEETDETITVDADSDWKYEFTELDKYDDQGKEIVYTVDEEAVEGYEKSFDGNDITNLRVGKTEVTGEKNWVEVDERYRPDSIIVQLLANGEEEATVEVSSETDWSYAFTDLAKYDKNGKEIDYTVEELDVPAGYDSEVDGYDITNTQKVTEVSGTKAWLDDGSKDRPNSITVQVKNGDQVIDEREVTAEDEWSYSFRDLPQYNKEGKEINYTVDEEEVNGYKKSIKGHDITNLRVGETDVAGTKTWKGDKADNRPDMITVHLLQNGEVVDTEEVTAEDDWEYSFTDLPAYDEKGVAYEYAVAEDEVKGYKTSVDGFDITNTFIKEDAETSEEPGSTGDPKDSDQPGGDQTVSVDAKPSDETAEETKAGALPKTATNLFRMLFVGSALLLVGAGIMLIRRKRYS